MVWGLRLTNMITYICYAEKKITMYILIQNIINLIFSKVITSLLRKSASVLLRKLRGRIRNMMTAKAIQAISIIIIPPSGEVWDPGNLGTMHTTHYMNSSQMYNVKELRIILSTKKTLARENITQLVSNLLHNSFYTSATVELLD